MGGQTREALRPSINLNSSVDDNLDADGGAVGR
jgi:hypothetical protein